MNWVNLILGIINLIFLGVDLIQGNWALAGINGFCGLIATIAGVIGLRGNRADA